MMNEEQRWQAVLARDAQADGTFVYAVRSTGIYCRPTCPSRRPKREHVLFFARPEAAEQAHFRPCLRCSPRTMSAGSAQVGWIEEVCRYIETHLDEPLTLEALSAHAHHSPHYLHRTFKRIMGVTPRQYAEAVRLQRFKAELKDGVDVTRAVFEAGYGSSSRVYERVPAHMGMTPGSYRQGGRREEIVYTVVASPLGRLLVATTERGICAVTLGDADDTLTAALEREYPAATVERDDRRLQPWVRQILAYLQGQQPHLDLPLDVQATAFQWRVWQALQAIPHGDTRSYGEIAGAIGQPSAARAVARACATNPVALVIPCHRVVREDGGLGGYRWGTARKEALLALEGETGAQLGGTETRRIKEMERL